MRDYLSSDRWWDRLYFLVSPVRAKNIEKIAGYLNSLSPFVQPGQEPSNLCAVLDQLKEPSRLSYDSAWDLADTLEIELIRQGDDPYLETLLRALAVPSRGEEKSLWDQHFSPEERQKLLDSYHSGAFSDTDRIEVRRKLEYIFQERTKGWRLDRARARLRGNYLSIMAVVLLALLILLGRYYVLSERQLPDPTLCTLLWLVFLAGAVGSVLSRAYKLGKQPSEAESAEKQTEPPLGIRALTSAWRVFLAQPIIDGTFALVLFTIFRSGLVQLAGLTQLNPSAYSAIGFLAGFSEPFAIDVLSKVAGQAGSPSK